MAGKVVVNQVQLGDASTATQNFVWQTNVDGTCKLARGNTGATTQDIITVDTSGNVAFPQKVSQTTPQSMVRLNTANGYGSTNTVIRRFTNAVTNQGIDITYVDSATLGASFTIANSGVYSISYSDNFSAATQMGLSLNSAQLTTAINSINVYNVLVANTNQGANGSGAVSWTGYLNAGSIVRAHNSGVTTGTLTTQVQFTITRVA